MKPVPVVMRADNGKMILDQASRSTSAQNGVHEEIYCRLKWLAFLNAVLVADRRTKRNT
jgi:hypothetical protein